jgi:hypothetical protein
MGLGYARTTMVRNWTPCCRPPARFSPLEPIGRVRHTQVRGTRHDMQLELFTVGSGGALTCPIGNGLPGTLYLYRDRIRVGQVRPTVLAA